jgi:hypothetical protein
MFQTFSNGCKKCILKWFHDRSSFSSICPTVGSKQYIVHDRSSFSTIAFNTKKKKLQDFAWFNSDKPQFFYQNYMLGLYYTSTE